MEKIDAKILGVVSVTLLTRLAGHLEREGVLPRGWTATELRDIAATAETNILRGSDPEFHHAFARALQRIAQVCLQPVPEGSAETKEPA
ncbi:hypothetical protein GXW78_25580 [Roseomonas terrae]|jgi:hypothetical protein|uniref:Uncharacterized protein n=1 Tax=Neoroseomonas terrae TaxID=424799 RepID=A0ABS5EPU6_9PROT|nr:hypothetical protein [Neoroseomonas terrae]MBR0653053.1 hypothetical protein [Neoroseomonas terrae]